MEALIFLLSFTISMGQIWAGERQYDHRTILIPCVLFSFGLGLIIGYGNGWELAAIFFTLSFITRFFVGSLRFFLMIRYSIEQGSDLYWKAFAVGAMCETTAVFLTLKNMI